MNYDLCIWTLTGSECMPTIKKSPSFDAISRKSKWPLSETIFCLSLSRIVHHTKTLLVQHDDRYRSINVTAPMLTKEIEGADDVDDAVSGLRLATFWELCDALRCWHELTSSCVWAVTSKILHIKQRCFEQQNCEAEKKIIRDPFMVLKNRVKNLFCRPWKLQTYFAQRRIRNHCLIFEEYNLMWCRIRRCKEVFPNFAAVTLSAYGNYLADIAKLRFLWCFLLIAFMVVFCHQQHSEKQMLVSLHGSCWIGMCECMQRQDSILNKQLLDKIDKNSNLPSPAGLVTIILALKRDKFPVQSSSSNIAEKYDLDKVHTNVPALIYWCGGFTHLPTRSVVEMPCVLLHSLKHDEKTLKAVNHTLSITLWNRSCCLYILLLYCRSTEICSSGILKILLISSSGLHDVIGICAILCRRDVIYSITMPYTIVANYYGTLS